MELILCDAIDADFTAKIKEKEIDREKGWRRLNKFLMRKQFLFVIHEVFLLRTHNFSLNFHYHPGVVSRELSLIFCELI